MTHLDRFFRENAFGKAFRFVSRHWRRQKGLLALMLGAGLLATLADAIAPVFAGRLVNDIGLFSSTPELARDQAIRDFAAMLALGLAMVGLRAVSFYGIIRFTLKMMPDVASEAFYKVQRLSSDWHANSFAGSTVRKITRAMWSLDGFNDTIIVALFPKLVMLIGASTILWLHWPVMGLVVGAGSIAYVALVVSFSLGYIAPAAQLSNAWDTSVGGVLADSVSCNAVVKSFAGEAREDEIVGQVIAKWRKRTRRTWGRFNIAGNTQMVVLWLFRGATLGTALILAWNGQANAGDLTFVLALFFVVQGYLQDVGQQVRDLQRAVNEMEELIDIHAVPFEVSGQAGCL